MQTLNLTKKYERYSEYKDSGVEWLGKIPKEWDVANSRGIFTTQKDRVGSSFGDYKILSLTLHGVIPKVLDGSGKNPAEYDTYQVIKKDNLVFCLFDYDVTPRTIGYVEENGMLTGAYTRLIPKSETYSKYYYYYFLSLDYHKELLHLCTGLRNSIPKPLFWSMKNPLPHIKIQEEISNYLDKKTAMVDQIINRKEKQIELLKEKRTKVINHSVNNTKGVNEKLKYIAPERREKLDIAPTNLKYLGLENIESNTGKMIDSSEETQPESSVNIFKAGDVLFGKLRPYLAKVFTANFNGVCSGEFLTLIPKQTKILPEFLFYKLISEDFIKAVNDSTYGSKMPRANWQFIGNQQLTYPSIVEQQKIIDLINKETKLIYEIIQNIEKSIETLQEFKSSLISNVVTGKIKI
jgi:restriction endonuclease S subunit